MTKAKKIKICWLLFDAEKKGSENQCRGLAKALGLKDIVLKPMPKAGVLSFLPRPIWFPFLSFNKGLLRSISGECFPDLVISSGTRSSVVAAFLKKKTPSISVVNVLNPRLYHGLFDLIITPEHDGVTGPNILTTLGSLHGLTPKKISKEADGLQGRFEVLQSNKTKPVVTLLLGGPSKSFKMKKSHFEVLGQQVAHLYRAKQARFLVSFSRRTPPDFKDAFLKATKGVPMELYDPSNPQGENPYFAYLGLADHIIVSADSISMVTEACATGKPVHIMTVQKMPRKFRQFHQALEAKGLTKPFRGSLEKWSTPPLNETQRIAQEVKTHLCF